MRTIRTRLRAHDPDRDRGAAMVEFALVLPILLILTLGIINFIPVFDEVNLYAQATFRCEWE